MTKKQQNVDSDCLADILLDWAKSDMQRNGVLAFFREGEDVMAAVGCAPAEAAAMLFGAMQKSEQMEEIIRTALAVLESERKGCKFRNNNKTKQ